MPEETDVLWGGTLASISFDPTTWSLRCGVEVVTDGLQRSYWLDVDEVSEWRASRDVPLPWTYAELTEVHVSPAGQQTMIELVLWSDGTSLTARGSRVRVEPAN